MIDPQIVLAACVCASTAQVYAPGEILSKHNIKIKARMLFNSSYCDPGLAIPAAAPSHQFHAQDEFGQFSFGHAGGPSARTEVILIESLQLGINHGPKHETV